MSIILFFFSFVHTNHESLHYNCMKTRYYMKFITLSGTKVETS